MNFKNTKLFKWCLKNKKKSIVIGSVLSLVLIILIGGVSYFIYYKTTTLPSNAYFKNVYLGNMNKRQIQEQLDKSINPSFTAAKINITVGESSKELDLAPYNFKFDAKTVFDACKKCDFSRNETPYVKISCDKSKLESDVNSLAPSFTVEPTDYTYKTEGSTLYVEPGKQGTKISAKNLISGIINAAQDMDFGNIALNCETFENDLTAINISDLHNKVAKNCKDASYSIDANGNLKYDSEVTGVDFNVETAKATVTDPLNGQYRIPLIITPAKVTVSQLKRQHDSASCPSLISTYTTKLSTYGDQSQNRNYNIAKAAAAINGIVLYPNEAFSALKAIGPANSSQGYKDAEVYTTNGPSTDAGGGVCQVSTTAYLAAMYGYMDITERHPHSYTVGYVPLGYDAAFSSPSTDLRFKNNRNNPIRITANVTDSSVTVSIFGTPSDLDNCKVTLSSTVLQTIAPETEQRSCDSLALGQTQIETNGQNGYVVSTHKTVVKNGVVIEDSYISSSYKPIAKVILVGTNPSL